MTVKTMIRRGAQAALALLLLSAAGAAHADPFEAKSMRWEEDYSAQARDHTPLVGLQRLKVLPLTADGGMWLSAGGELREKVDIIRSSQLGLSAYPAYDTATTRAYLHADAHLGEHVRVFGQLSWADEGGRRGPDRSYDESGVDVQQLFVDLAPAAGARLRLGRQELPLGDQRLSEVRETYDLRRSFDAARLDLTAADGATLTAFSAALVLNHPGPFDDREQPGERFQGVYTALPSPRTGGGIDLFWLERRRRAAVYAEGTAPERRETWGVRAHGAHGAFDYNLYGLAQTGRFGSADIRAWAASADLGWTGHALAWSPRLSLRADVASGDARRGDGEMNSFDAPYPNTSYLSTSSAYWPGNAWSVFPLATLKPSRALTLYLGAQSVSRMSRGDSFYYSPQAPLALPAGHGQVMMRQVYARARWEPIRDVTVSTTVIRQFAGDPVRARGGRDGTIISLAADWKF
ncbi:alginate export family protein [Phenylobacterium aquaticum]|uniref:alginate export family protein n=1 Tax=Phenylobacterium aquaticum TaxID=1763816 RepID=UPI001F5D6709|nr:alginate export family protein [Phenylobacterium aquaticum]